MMEPDELLGRRERDLTREPARAREAESRLEGGRPRQSREPELDVDGAAATDSLATAALTDRQPGRAYCVEQRGRQLVVVGDDVGHVEDDLPRRGEELDRHARSSVAQSRRASAANFTAASARAGCAARCKLARALREAAALRRCVAFGGVEA
ncbi:hypothetical protein O0S08_27375 [Nannocystis poenicansa]|uniref:Uncharacterized protein n=1 Tax=Nannocystis punicea TaxID=2995304 RepID=A0ABY7GSK4_9BACT|nr:hypothetical protein [Nannocystis poenicansa]WAS89931.1 hypothetical protein O0S08_27375 [Nannocystis poenicansa]